MEILKTVLAGVGAFSLARWLVLLVLKAKGGKLPKIGTMDLILVIIGISIALFTLKMIQLFEQYMAVPESLVTCFFALCGGECGVMGMIQNSKNRKQERSWQMEDQERARKETESARPK